MLGLVRSGQVWSVWVGLGYVRQGQISSKVVPYRTNDAWSRSTRDHTRRYGCKIRLGLIIKNQVNM